MTYEQYLTVLRGGAIDGITRERVLEHALDYHRDELTEALLKCLDNRVTSPYARQQVVEVFKAAFHALAEAQNAG